MSEEDVQALVVDNGSGMCKVNRGERKASGEIGETRERQDDGGLGNGGG